MKNLHKTEAEKTSEFMMANPGKANELLNANPDNSSQNDVNNEFISGLIDMNEEKGYELTTVSEELASQNKVFNEVTELINENEENAFALVAESKKNISLNDTVREAGFENIENASELNPSAGEENPLPEVAKAEREEELMRVNNDLAYQYREKEKQVAELMYANKELAYLIDSKDKQSAELTAANQRLLHQHGRMEKKATELTIANEWFLKSEENFHRSIADSPLGIQIISMTGKTVYVNQAFLEMYEIESMEEFENIPAIERYTPESYRQHMLRKRLRKKGREVQQYEKSMISKNGEIRYVKVWRKEVLWNGLNHYQVINLDITEQKRAEEALKTTQQEFRNFATHLQDIREEEKMSLSREIHDDLGQILVALKIDLGMIKKEFAKGIENIKPDEIQAKFDQLADLVDKTIKTTRRIMNGLRPELIELLGFIEAAKSYLQEFQERLGISCQFKCDIIELKINQQQSIALFRILQEALTNVAKHARASDVKFHLFNKPHKLIMEVTDNGVGYDQQVKNHHDSYGFIIMKERVVLLGGELSITSKIGKGTTVRVEMPYEQ